MDKFIAFRNIGISAVILSLVSIEVSLAEEEITPNSRIRFIDAIEIGRDESQGQFRVGGLSSLYMDPESTHLIAISDDTSTTGAPRLHAFTLQLTHNSLSIKPEYVVELVNEQRESFQPGETIDAEAFDKLPNGNWLVSSEGINLNERFTIPQLLEFNTAGTLVKRWPYPSHYLPVRSANPETGIRSNAAFEGMALTADKRFLILAAEKALYQDGASSSMTSTSQVRIMRLSSTDDGYSQPQEFLYELSVVPAFTEDETVFKIIGISDILVLSETNLLVVERAFVASPVNRNTVKLYLVDLPAVEEYGAANEADESATLPTVDKTLWLDFDNFLSESGFPGIDNVEGIIMGPALANGNSTLIVVTDNNFSARQKTLFYAFEIINSKD